MNNLTNCYCSHQVPIVTFFSNFQRQREELGQMTKQERRAEQLMKRVTRDVHRLKRNHPNALTTSFRYKIVLTCGFNGCSELALQNLLRTRQIQVS